MNPNTIMHTTTKKKLRSEHGGRSRWPFVRVFASLCTSHRASLTRTRTHTRAHAVCESCEYARAYFWDKELCKHEFTSGGHYCPGPGASYPSGTSLVQSFLLVTLPVTSTSMRYDRYDTCLHVCLCTRPSSTTRECFANSDEPADRHVSRDFGATPTLRHPRENYFSRTRRDARNCKRTGLRAAWVK